MSVNSEVELVMQFNTTAKVRVNHSTWAPRATSTPVRKPLLTLSNTGIPHNFKQYEAFSGKIDNLTTANKVGDVQHYQANPKRSLVKKNENKKSRKSLCLDDDDDDDDEDGNDDERKNLRRKPLIIKLGSSQCVNRSTKTRSPVSSVKKTVSPSCKRSSRRKDSVPDLLEDNEKSVEKDVKNLQTTNLDGQRESCILGEVTNELEQTESHISQAKCVLSDEKDAIQKQPKEAVSSISRKSASLKRKIQAATVVSDKKLKNRHEQKHQPSDKGPEKNDKVKKGKSAENTDKNACEKVKKNTPKLSISHEIFSDTKEKEFRDSLDLTVADEFEAAAKSNLPMDKSLIKTKGKHKYSSKLKNSHSKSKLKTIAIRETNVGNVGPGTEKLGRPKRTIKSPKKFWLPRSPPNKTIESQQSQEDNVNGNVNESKDVAVSSRSKASPGKLEEFDDQIVDEVGSRDGVSHNNGLVKDLTQMTFTENSGEGKEVFSVALGWQFSSFKCCVLKIGIKCEASGRTKWGNSHFGGVLLKGRLSMRIKENEVIMKAGHMFCVPPLTHWRAVNKGKSDCIVYYWCGRF